MNSLACPLSLSCSAASTAISQKGELDLVCTRVVAPVDGYVTNLNVPPGNYSRIGQAFTQRELLDATEVVRRFQRLGPALQ